MSDYTPLGLNGKPFEEIRTDLLDTLRSDYETADHYSRKALLPFRAAYAERARLLAAAIEAVAGA